MLKEAQIGSYDAEKKGGGKRIKLLKIFLTDGLFLPRFLGTIFNYQSEPRISHISAAHKPIQGAGTWGPNSNKAHSGVRRLTPKVLDSASKTLTLCSEESPTRKDPRIFPWGRL